MQKNIVIGIVIVVLLGGSFFGGMQYGASKSSSSRAGGGNFANLSPEERQARIAQFGQGTGIGGGNRGPRTGGGFVAGEVLSLDDKGFTVKLADGGSKIVFWSASSTVMTSMKGDHADVKVGSEVMVAGSANQDGSVNAQSVQLRDTTGRTGGGN